MSSYMTYYIVGKNWGEKDFGSVETFTSNIIRDDIRDGSISASYYCDNKEAEKLIKEKIRSNFKCTDEEYERDCKYYEDNLRYLTLDDIKSYMNELDKSIDSCKERIEGYTKDKAGCLSSEVYDRICEKIEEEREYIKELEKSRDDVRYAYDGLGFYLYHVKDYDDVNDSYIIAFTIM